MTGYHWISLLLSGSFFFLSGYVREGVTIDGTDVGGMRYEAAEELLRERLRVPPLIVTTPAGSFDATEQLSFTDDLSVLVRTARRGASLTSTVRRTWVGMEEFLSYVCEKNARDSADARVEFTAAGFEYTPETRGIACDYRKLLSDANRALSTGETSISLTVRTVEPEITEETLRERTAPLSSYTTYFDGENLSRAHNIALAAERISGVTIGSGGRFSFNEVVGKRTEENGFLRAAVIYDGEFVQGVGGGVCQASSTLFNAALLAGLKIDESRPHSLSVGYVPPSLDAMVSEVSDLKFTNVYPFPVYLLAKTGRNWVRFSFFGPRDGRKYETESKVLMRVAPPAPRIAGEGEVPRVGREGIASESYLLCYEGETLLSRTRIRRDTYAAVQGIISSSQAEGDKGEQSAEQADQGENFGIRRTTFAENPSNSGKNG